MKSIFLLPGRSPQLFEKTERVEVQRHGSRESLLVWEPAVREHVLCVICWSVVGKCCPLLRYN